MAYSSQNTSEESIDDTFDQYFDQHFDQTFENFTIHYGDQEEEKNIWKNELISKEIVKKTMYVYRIIILNMFYLINKFYL